MVYKIYKTDVYVPRCLRCRGFFIVNATVAVLYHTVRDDDAVTSCTVCDADAVLYLTVHDADTVFIILFVMAMLLHLALFVTPTLSYMVPPAFCRLF